MLKHPKPDGRRYEGSTGGSQRRHNAWLSDRAARDRGPAEGRASTNADRVEALRAGLRDLGYVEGRNIVIEFRWADERYDRLSDLAAELIRLNVDVIVTAGTPAIRALKNATTTISRHHGDQWRS